MEDIKQYLEFYKRDLIKKQAMEVELAKGLGLVTFSSVVLETPVGKNTNSTFLAAVVPELVNGDLRSVFVMDDRFLKEVLSNEEISAIFESLAKVYQLAVLKFNNFVRLHAGMETPLSECLAVYLDIYNMVIEALPKDIEDRLIESKALTPSNARDALKGLTEGTESVTNVVEFCSVMNVIPKYMIDAAQRLFKLLNGGGSLDVASGDTQDAPSMNYNYSKLKSYSTGWFDPERHEDIDPDYIPKR